jgi:hypothetical protein
LGDLRNDLLDALLDSGSQPRREWPVRNYPFGVEEVHVIEIERPSWWRSSTPPSNWSNSAVRRPGLVRLPEHLCWSGPVSEFNLDDPAELRVV